MDWEMPDGTHVLSPPGSNIVYENVDIRNYTKPKLYTYDEAFEIWRKAKYGESR